MYILKSSASFTRPNTNTQYTSGDIVANSATNTLVTPMTFTFPASGLKIWRVGLLRSSTTVTDAQFRLHLYNDLPTVTNGDNDAWVSIAAGYQGYIDIDGQNTAFSDDSQAFGVYLNNSVFAPMFIVADVDAKVYGLMEARDTYTPTANEVFTVTLLGEAYS